MFRIEMCIEKLKDFFLFLKKLVLFNKHLYPYTQILSIQYLDVTRVRLWWIYRCVTYTTTHITHLDFFHSFCVLHSVHTNIYILKLKSINKIMVKIRNVDRKSQTQSNGVKISIKFGKGGGKKVEEKQQRGREGGVENINFLISLFQ